MSDASRTISVEPDGAPRIGALDILRGVAILGILFMNINEMGASFWASFGDVRQIGWSAVDQVAWWLRQVFAFGTARAMLEMLFGAGMVILTDRAAQAVQASAAKPSGVIQEVYRIAFGPAAVMRSYYWRNFVLFVFGLIHIFILMWFGDILHTYGIAAMVAFLFRRLDAKALLGIGLMLAMAQLLGGGLGALAAQKATTQAGQLDAKQASGQTLTAAETAQVAAFSDQQTQAAQQNAAERQRVAFEDRQRSAATGTFASWSAASWSAILFIWGYGDRFGPAMFMEGLFIWEAAGTMLIGAALYKWGVIQGRRSRRFYWKAMLAGYAVGVTCRLCEAYAITRFDDAPAMIYATTEISRLATTLAHIAAIHLLLGTAIGVRMLRPFAAAGRTALTIYVAQTIVCMWLLYAPFTLGLYAKQGWMALMLTALAINIAMLIAANWYVRHFDIAPVEWAWRSIVARKMLPWRKHPKTGDNPVSGGISAG